MPRTARRLLCLTGAVHAGPRAQVIYYVRRTPPEEINMEYLRAKRKALYMELAVRDDCRAVGVG